MLYHVPQQKGKSMSYACSFAVIKLENVIINICHFASQRQLQDVSFTSMPYLERILTR